MEQIVQVLAEDPQKQLFGGILRLDRAEPLLDLSEFVAQRSPQVLLGSRQADNVLQTPAVVGADVEVH